MNRHLLYLTLFVLSTSFVKMNAQELTAYGGFWAPEYYQDDTKITRKEFKELLLGYDESAIYWKKRAKNETLFYIAYVPTLGAAAWFGAEAGRDNGDMTTPALATLGGLIISSIFVEGVARNGKKAMLTYNKQFDGKETSFNLIPVLNGNGLGLALKF